MSDRAPLNLEALRVELLRALEAPDHKLRPLVEAIVARLAGDQGHEPRVEAEPQGREAWLSSRRTS